MNDGEDTNTVPPVEPMAPAMPVAPIEPVVAADDVAAEPTPTEEVST